MQQIFGAKDEYSYFQRNTLLAKTPLRLLRRSFFLFLHNCFKLFRVMGFCALRANAMADIGVIIFMYVDIDLLPVALVVPDFFTKQADW